MAKRRLGGKASEMTFSFINNDTTIASFLKCCGLHVVGDNYCAQGHHSHSDWSSHNGPTDSKYRYHGLMKSSCALGVSGSRCSSIAL